MKFLSGKKRYILGGLAMAAAAAGAVPAEWQNSAIGITGALAMLTRLVDSLWPAD